jgi:hypothetical protein
MNVIPEIHRTQKITPGVGGWYHISGVIVSVLAHIIVDYNMGICCFLAKHAALRRKNKNLLAPNQGNVFERVTCLSADCYFSDLAIKIQLSLLV